MSASTPALIPVILAGGKGERFWPLSRIQRPKQFLCLDGHDRSLLQATVDRLLPVAGGWEHIWVITASHLEAGVKAQLPELPAANLLVEPEGRDTAPAVAWATLEVAKRYGDRAIAGFFPADHWIGDLSAYHDTLATAAAVATQAQGIVTLGIQPNYPATGYGYIEQGAGVEANPAAYMVTRFTEKPDQATATAFLATGRFSWNSGMFIFPVQVMLAELRTYVPALMTTLTEQGISAYPTLTKLSIDYAVMEQTQQAYVLPVDFGWDDLGDWNAIERLVKQPDQTNVELGQHVGLDTTGSIVYTRDRDELVVTIGLEDIVVVRDGNATLIARKDRTQDIKTVLKELKGNENYQSFL